MPQLTRAILLLAVLALAACGGPGGRVSYRDAGLSLYSNASLDPARLQGEWVQAAGFQRPNGGRCGGGRAGFTGAEGRLRVDASLCLSGRTTAFNGFADVTGPGRISLSGADPQGIGQEWWVIWADVDYRTLVIGTPSGDFGFILNRGGALPPDRLKAAKEILDWNGYDLTRLRVF